jgi:uncharacterized membrane protein
MQRSISFIEVVEALGVALIVATVRRWLSGT